MRAQQVTAVRAVKGESKTQVPSGRGLVRATFLMTGALSVASVLAGRAESAQTPPASTATATSPSTPSTIPAPPPTPAASSPAHEVIPPTRGVKRAKTACVQDDPAPTPRNYAGWDTSAVVAWKYVEVLGGMVPDIEEDSSQSPPAWWRYPSPLRSAALLAAEARSPIGLYEKGDASDLMKGDILVRTDGVGACGKMAVLAPKVQGHWATVEARTGEDDEDEASPFAPGRPSADFFAADGLSLKPGVEIFRIKVRNESTLGHVRELRRDLDHLERTLGPWPPLLARATGARDVVDDKLHDLLDEAWSLVADSSFDDDRRELTGRVLALAAGLGWPGADVAAAAVLDDVLSRAPTRPDALAARAMVALLAGDKERALAWAEKAAATPGAAARAEVVKGQALMSLGQRERGLASFQRALELDPRDFGARREVTSPMPVVKPAEATPSLPLVFRATRDAVGLDVPDYAVRAAWPMSWRVVGLSSTPTTGALVNLATGRVLLDDGTADKGSAVLFVQKPDATERARLVKAGARNLFPEAKLKKLPPLIPGSKRESFKEGKGVDARAGEVTTFEHDGVLAFLVLNAPAAVYPKLAEEYAAFVKSLTFLPRS